MSNFHELRLRQPQILLTQLDQKQPWLESPRQQLVMFLLLMQALAKQCCLLASTKLKP
jgi:hypothetical protein